MGSVRVLLLLLAQSPPSLSFSLCVCVCMADRYLSRCGYLRTQSMYPDTYAQHMLGCVSSSLPAQGTRVDLFHDCG